MADLPLLTIHTDGASRGNPGAAAFAYIISRAGEDDIEEADCLGQMTNNQAEYTALVRALEHSRRLGVDHRLIVHSDSELMVKQMKGDYKVKNEELRGLYQQARRLAEEFKGDVAFKHVRRELNKRADESCNEALDGKRELSAEQLIAAYERQKAPSPPPARRTLREEAIELLRRAGAQPAPEAVWQQMTALLKKHGVEVVT